MAPAMDNDFADPAGIVLAGMLSKDVFSLLEEPVFHAREKVKFSPLQI